MRQLHCIHCGIIIKGNFRGKNEFVRYPKGLLHESCRTKYDKEHKYITNKDWSKYVMQHRNKDTYNKYHKQYARDHKKVKVQ